MKGKADKKNIFRRSIAILAAVLIVFTSVPAEAFAAQTDQNLMNPEYDLVQYDQRYSVFTNYVKGYEVKLDKELEIDATNLGVVAAFDSPDKRVEIYKQNIAASSVEGYINYSNKFLTNDPTTHTLIAEWTNTPADTGEQTEAVQPAGLVIRFTQWTRPALSKVENDKNHYLCIEIPEGKYVYSFFIKTTYQITNAREYESIVESFRTFSPIRGAKSFKAEKIDPDDRNWNRETREFYDTYFAEDADLTWGIFEPEVDYTGFHNLEYYENYIDYEFPVLLSYGEVQNTSINTVRSRLENAYSRGKVLELTLQTNWTSTGNMVCDILDGKYDTYLYDYANTIADFGHPVLFRLFNEMNGDWCPYSSYNTSKDTVIFREVYRYIYGIFEECGANKNTLWVWNPNEGSFPNFEWNNTLMYYPGDEYIDIVGLTAYNTGTYYPGETWQSFNQLYSDLYDDYCKWFDHPFMITEFSCASTGGDKVAWMEDMFKQIKKYDRINIAIWWDGADRDAQGNIARNYYIKETPETLEAFKNGIVPPWYLDTYA